jgi:hypothetical protein
MRLIFISRKEEAKLFKKWVTQVINEVITNGKYEFEQNTILRLEQNTRLALEANKKIIRKERHQALVRAYEKNFVVYLIELEDFTPKYKDPANPNDTSRIIKIGSTKNIRTRLDGLTQAFGECTLIDCYKCACYEDFENYLFQHEFIKPFFITIIEGKRETYKFDDDTYSKVLDIIRSDIKQFNNISHEEIVERMRHENDIALEAYKYKIAKEERLKADSDIIKAERDIIKAERDAKNAVIINKAKTISALAESERLREAKNLKILELMENNSNNTGMIAIMNKLLNIISNEKLINVKVSDFDSLVITDTATHMPEPDSKNINEEAIQEDSDEPELNHESEIELEINAYLDNLNDDDLPAEAPKAQDTYVNIMNQLNPIEDKSCKGPLVQQYDPFTMQLIKTFNGYIDAVREVNSTSAAGIRAAVKARSVYNGFRWFTIARDAEPVQYEIPPTVEIQRSRRGLIAMLDLDQAHILKVYDSVNSASKEQKFSSGAAISKAINSNTKSGNKYWRRWEDCNDEQQREYLEHNELPEVMEIASGSVKINQYHPVSKEFIKTFNSITDITKEYQMSRASLFKAIKSKKQFKGFIWNYITPMVEIQ